MYRLLGIRAEGFRLFKQRATVNFSSLRNRVVAVVGVNEDTPSASSNMSGKSTFANALTWCLYGCDLSGNALAGDVVSRGMKSCDVGAVFEDVHDPTKRVVVRRKRKGTTTTLIVNDAVLNASAGERRGPAAEMQPYVDALFGVREVFLAAHVFGYEEGGKPFALESDATKKRLFNLLVDTTDLDALLVKATARRDAIHKELSDKETRLCMLRSSADLVKARGQALQDKIAAQRGTHATARGDVDAAKDNLDLAEKEKERAEAIRDARLKEFRDVQREKARLATEAQALINQLRNQRDALAALTVGAPCPTCQQTLHGDAHALALKNATKAWSDAAERATQTSAVYQASCVKPTDLVQAEGDAVAAFVAFQEASTKYAKLRGAHEAVVKTYDAELRKEVESLRTLTAQSKRMAADVAVLQDGLAFAEFWRTAFGPKGIRGMRMEQVIPVLNASARAYSQALFGDGQRVVYSTTSVTKGGDVREAFDVCLMDAADNPVAVCSAGQALRRDVINLLAISDLASALGKRTCSLLIFDEAFRTLDAAGIDAVCNVLYQKRAETELTLVIEHNEDLSTRFDTTLLVTRVGGEASLTISKAYGRV